MVAALYGERERLMPADLNTDKEVWGHIALVVIQDGLNVVEHRADLIDAQESYRTLADPSGWRCAAAGGRGNRRTTGGPGGLNVVRPRPLTCG